MKTDIPFAHPHDYDDLPNSIRVIAENLRSLHEIGVAQSTPVVERITATRSSDAHEIQHTLDHLLDFACHPYVSKADTVAADVRRPLSLFGGLVT